jgi:glutamate dehydrogenase
MSMHGTIPAARKKVIEQIASTARRAQKRSDPVTASRFIRQYFRGVGEEDLAQYAKADLAAMSLSHMRFATLRKRGRPVVRVFNTEAARDSWSSPHTIVQVVVDDMPFLVDSVSMVLNQSALTIHLMIHLIIPILNNPKIILLILTHNR